VLAHERAAKHLNLMSSEVECANQAARGERFEVVQRCVV
jgi:hypothetical protein